MDVIHFYLKRLLGLKKPNAKIFVSLTYVSQGIECLLWITWSDKLPNFKENSIEIEREIGIKIIYGMFAYFWAITSVTSYCHH